MKEPDFRVPDAALLRLGLDPMEVAQIPMRGRLPTYKPHLRNASYFQIHHLPNRLCNGLDTQQLLSNAVGDEVARRRSPQPCSGRVSQQ
jgi:hypothetical protein